MRAHGHLPDILTAPRAMLRELWDWELPVRRADRQTAGVQNATLT